jgi:hypothetical protein
VQNQTYGVCAAASNCSCDTATVANNCSVAGDLACTSSVCCAPSTPYYCPSSNLCYATPEDAYGACPTLACISCN